MLARTARSSASAIRCCVRRCWPGRLRRNNGRPIARWRRFSPPTHTRSPATWHRAEAAAGPDQQLAQDLVRAADQSRTRQGYAAASAAMERAALLSDDTAWPPTGWRPRPRTPFWPETPIEPGRSRLACWTGRVRRGRRAGPCSRSGCSRSTPVRCPRRRAPRLRRRAAGRRGPHPGPRRAGAGPLPGQRRGRFQRVCRRIHEAADHNDPEQRMLSDFTRGVAAILGGDQPPGGAARRRHRPDLPPTAAGRPAVAPFPRAGRRVPR